MRITAVRATPVTVPYTSPATMSVGVADASPRTIIEVETDAGLTGLGEAAYAFPAAIVNGLFAPQIIGLDPRERTTVRRHCLPDHPDFGTPHLRLHQAAWGGLELALWDLLGKQLQLPLFRVWGGPVRGAAPFVAYAYTDAEADHAPSDMARIARERIAASGAAIFEFKLGHHPVEVDIATVRAVRDALPSEVGLAVDVNMGYTLEESRLFLREVGHLLANVEEPTPRLADMDRLHEEFGVQVSSHMCDLDVLASYPGIAGVVPTLDVIGGAQAFLDLAREATTRGRRVWLRSHAELGIGWAAMVHLGMSTPEVDRPAQALIDMMVDDLIEGSTWLVRDGGVVPPEAPGLGVVLDRDALARWHQHHLDVGETIIFPPALRPCARDGRDRTPQ